LLWVVILFVALTALATLALYDNGRLALVWGDWVVEMSATMAVALVLGVLVVGFIGIQLVLWLWRLPHRWRERRALKRLARAEAGVGAGLLAGEHGDWKRAERMLIKSARYSDQGVMNYLAAARMAHNQGAFQRRDRYLAEARERYPEQYATIALVEARLRRQQAPDQALAILQALMEQGEDTPAVLAEYADLLAEQGHWAALRELMPKLEKSRALDKDALKALQRRMWIGLLHQAETLEALENIWHYLDAQWWRDPEVLATYVERRLALGGDQAGLAALIEQALKKHWDARLVYLYGLVEEGPAFERLKVVEKWLKKHPKDAVVLLTAGRLACRAQLWGQAQAYLREALNLKPSLEGFATLARCLQAEGDDTQAALTYQAAVEALAPESLMLKLKENHGEKAQA
ncbi:MAG TPA: heme biosynthesis protein HemY, partial [Sulfurivirga caldicuralii]|nr:heme biosynthesis protein HemY [Sulfurivirga caldicuralii]